jgi:hypothetical protein
MRVCVTLAFLALLLILFVSTAAACHPRPGQSRPGTVTYPPSWAIIEVQNTTSCEVKFDVLVHIIEKSRSHPTPPRPCRGFLRGSLPDGVLAGSRTACYQLVLSHTRWSDGHRWYCSAYDAPMQPHSVMACSCCCCCCCCSPECHL